MIPSFFLSFSNSLCTQCNPTIIVVITASIHPENPCTLCVCVHVTIKLCRWRRNRMPRLWLSNSVIRASSSSSIHPFKPGSGWKRWSLRRKKEREKNFSYPAKKTQVTIIIIINLCVCVFCVISTRSYFYCSRKMGPADRKKRPFDLAWIHIQIDICYSVSSSSRWAAQKWWWGLSGCSSEILP